MNNSINIIFSKTNLFILAQSMSRAAAGAFAYAPFAHGLGWGFSNTSTASSSPTSQKYSGLGVSSGNSAVGSTGASNNFGYPPTPPKDSGKTS